MGPILQKQAGEGRVDPQGAINNNRHPREMYLYAKIEVSEKRYLKRPYYNISIIIYIVFIYYK